MATEVPTTNLPRKTLRRAEVCACYGVGVDQVDRLVKAGRLRSVKVGRVRLIDVESADRIFLGVSDDDAS